MPTPIDTLRAEWHKAAQALRQFGRLSASRLLGTVPGTHGGYRAIVSMEERSLSMRAELNALTRLVAERLGVTDAELLAAFIEEFRSLAAEKGKDWPELRVDEVGIHIHDLPAYAARMKREGWPP